MLQWMSMIKLWSYLVQNIAFIKKVPLVRIKEYQAELLKWLHQHHENLFEDLKKMNALDETLENTLKNVMMQFTDEFINI